MCTLPGQARGEEHHAALHNNLTLTELTILALYAQAISYPYLRQVRGPHHEGLDHLDLGPLHAEVIEHCKCVIENPNLLLSKSVLADLGSTDRRVWTWPDVLSTVHHLMRELPHLKGVLVAFFKGVLKTWEQFAAEFSVGGVIERLMAAERLELPGYWLCWTGNMDLVAVAPTTRTAWTFFLPFMDCSVYVL